MFFFSQNHQIFLKFERLILNPLSKIIFQFCFYTVYSICNLILFVNNNTTNYFNLFNFSDFCKDDYKEGHYQDCFVIQNYKSHFLAGHILYRNGDQLPGLKTF